MQKKTLDILGRMMVLSVAFVAIMLVIMTVFLNNTITKARSDPEFTTIENYTFEKKSDQDAPLGFANTLSFSLSDINNNDSLIFFLNHHNIKVYIGDERVFEATSDDKFVRTTGGVWVNIPLTPDDNGKNVTIEMLPHYNAYSKKIPTIYLGNSLAVYKHELGDALPELILSLFVILTGGFILCLAVYNSVKHQAVQRLYYIGFMGIFAGIWRIAYAKIIYTAFPNHSQLIYTISIIALMLFSVSLIIHLGLGEDEKGAKYIGYISLGYCVCFFVQLLLQLFGVFDLREMLTFTHISIILSALTLFINGIYSFIKKIKAKNRPLKFNYSWILGIGVIADLLIYYFARGSSEMVFTLLAILCFSLLEGATLLIGYTRQKDTIEEMQTQLVLSRTTTMMSQIRSHFVFNILNAISGMCKYDPEKADDTIVRFARYLRSNIDIMENDKNIPFSADLRQLEDYVALEQVRFGDKVEFYEDIEVSNFLIPPLILQPVVENAIKHGVSQKLDNGIIILKTRDRGDRIEITVEDDGVGFDMEKLDNEKSVGLRNIRFRLEQLVNGMLDISSQVGKGTTVTITIPKKEQN